MKQFRIQFRQLSAIQIAVILLILGLFFGILTANVFKGNYFGQMEKYQNEVFPEISNGDIDYNRLFFRILGDNYKEFLLFWVLSITILGVPYMAFKITVFGFTAGFFISAVAMQYGFKGIILIFAYLFPHWIIYLPIYYFCLYKGYQLCRSIYFDRREYLGSIPKQVKQYLPLIFVLAVLLFFGSFLEAYAGSFLLKKALGLFI